MPLRRLKAKLHLRSGRRTTEITSHGPPTPQDPVQDNKGSALVNIEIPSEVSPKVESETSGHGKEDVSALSTAWNVSVRKLWNIAYEQVKRDEPELVQRYEADLQRTYNVQLRRDLAAPVLDVISLASAYIGGAASSNPYTALAWSGVSLLLPLLLNPCEQAESLQAGISYIATLVSQSRMWEDLYERRYEADSGVQALSPTSHAEYKASLGDLYVSILKYQITSYDYYTRKSAFRLGLDMIKWNDWESLLGEIREAERVFTAVSTTWRDMKYDEECQLAKKRHAESLERWEAIGSGVTGLREAVAAALADKQRTKLLEWLCDVDPSVIYNIAREKHKEGTGEWLVNTGCGKTVLSSTVIKNLRNKYDAFPDTALAYFYFSFADTQKQKVQSMASSLLRQLCCRRPDTPRPIQDLAQFKERGERPDLKSLEAALAATARGFKMVHIILDGLDECPALDGQRKRLLDSLRRIMAILPDCVHLLFTSRKEPDIEASLRPLIVPPARQDIDLSGNREEIDGDIWVYIESTLESEEFDDWPETLKVEVGKQLLKKADGMMQYVACQFDSLRKLSSVASVRDALGKLPVGLDATYERFLLAIDPDVQEQTINVLKFLCIDNSSWCRKLDVLAEVFAFRLHPDGTLDPKSQPLFTPRSVLKHLGSLVVVWQETYQSMSVRFSHFSIKEYLTSSRILQTPAKRWGFSEQDARCYVALVSLTYMLDVEFVEGWGPERSLLDDPWPALWDFTYHFDWLRAIESVPVASWPAELASALKRAFAPGSRTMWEISALAGEWRNSRDLIGLQKIIMEFKEDGLFAESIGSDPLRLAALLGFPGLTEFCLSIHEYLTQEALDAALQVAAYAGRREVVELLLDRGANANCCGPLMVGPPLMRALLGFERWVPVPRFWRASPEPRMLYLKGTQELLELLIDRGADVNATAKLTKADRLNMEATYDHIQWAPSPLSFAAVNGHEGWVQYLLDRGAAVCMDGICGVAAAAESNCIPILQLLLAKDTDSTVEDVNRYGGDDYGYPLTAAAEAMDGYAVMMLLEKGAKVNARDAWFGTPLHAACGSLITHEDWKGPKTRVVRCLLEHGADPNAFGQLGTPLQAACATSFIPLTDELEQEDKVDPIVLALLDQGADVNAPGGLYGSPLQAAAIGANYETFAELLRRGAAPNAIGGKYGTALQAAAWKGSLDKVKLLLDQGVDVNVQAGQYDSALRACLEPVPNMQGWTVRKWIGIHPTLLRMVPERLNTVHRMRPWSFTKRRLSIAHMLLEKGAAMDTAGHAAAMMLEPDEYLERSWRPWREMIDLFLERGFDINDTRGDPERSPTMLHGAFCTGEGFLNEDVIKYLLYRGAEPNRSVGRYGPPLAAFCALPGFLPGNMPAIHESLRKLLDICPTFDLNAQGGKFGCALQAAAYSGYEFAVRILLERGAEPDMKCGNYRSALNAAVVRGHWGIVEILLEAGARPDCLDHSEPDEDWLRQVGEGDGQGAVDRYRKFWNRQKEKSGR
ncbi:hypothetical protein VTJ49DRAFT_2685 [Mycothermus thermophilus]|uniref:NACHT domain-containing protein n=1 Tax=Humicola insolens TaxID=85995 RepID=A0ABR3V9K7_HUMIN